MGIAQDAGLGFQARLLGRICGCQNNSGRPIIDARRVARRDRAILLKHRTQTCQRFCSGCLGVFIGFEGHFFTLHQHVNRGDLAVKIACIDRRSRTGLGGQREIILIFAGDLMFLRDVFCRHAHVTCAKRAVQRAQHHVQGFDIAHLLAPALRRNNKGAARHRFGTASQREVGVTQHQRLHRRNDGLCTRAAQAVHIHRGRSIGHSCLHRRHARQIHVARFGVDDMPKHNGSDLLWFNAGPLHRGLGRDSCQINWCCAGQSAAKCADGCACAIQKNDVFHGVIFLLPRVAGQYAPGRQDRQP